ncbi:MAG TPA: c-type cytochrome [Burkholderiaceae bacterium]|nr:c-type cytochrome [Burkholderiaceae bacterium]
MKALIVSAFVACGLLAAGAAQASADLADKQCGKCHSMDKKGKGPSFKSISAKYKGNEAGAIKAATDPKGDHPELKAKTEDVQTVVKWILAQ